MEGRGMEPETHDAVARLNRVLDDLDVLYAESISTVENRIAELHSAIEKKTFPVSTTSQSDAEAMLQEIIAFQTGEMDRLLHDSAIKEEQIREVECQTHDLQAISVRLVELHRENDRLSAELACQKELGAQTDEFTRQVGERDERIEQLLKEQQEQIRQISALEEQRAEQLRLLQEKEEQAKFLHAEIQERDEGMKAMAAQMELLQSCRIRMEELEQLSEQYERERETVEDRAQALAAENLRLSEELDSLRKEYETLGKTLGQTELERTESARALMEWENSAAVLRDENKTLKAQLEEVLASQRALMEERDQATAAQEESRIALESVQRERESLNETLGAQRQELEETRTDAARQLADHNAALHEMETRLQRLQNADSEMAALQTALADRESNILHLEQVRAVDEEQRNRLELKIKMLLDQIETMQYQVSEVEALKQQIAKLEKELEEERAAIIRLKAQPPTPSVPAAASTPFAEPFLDAEESAVAKISSAARIRSAAATVPKGRRGNRKQMGEILVEAGVLSPKQLDEAMRFQAADPKRRLGSVLVEHGYVSEEVIAATLAAQLHIRFVENLEREMTPEAFNIVPSNLVKNHRCVPLYTDGGNLVVAMANPLDLIAIDDIEIATNARVEPASVTPTQLDAVIEKYYGRETTIGVHR